MKGMKILAVTSMSLALLAKAALVSHALAFTLFVDNVDPTTIDPTSVDYFGGVATVSGPTYVSAFIPDSSTASHSYSTPSVVRYGSISTIGPPGPPVPNTTSMFNTSKVAFTFQLENGFEPAGTTDPTRIFHQFLVEGTLSGTIGNDMNGIPQSNSSYKVTLGGGLGFVKDVTTNTFSTQSIDPINSASAQFIAATVDGQAYNIWLDDNVSVPAQGTQPLTISGYITTASVPEPGSVALLIGAGVSGGLFIRRRTRRA